jgi:hypothetical protein
MVPRGPAAERMVNADLPLYVIDDSTTNRAAEVVHDLWRFASAAAAATAPCRPGFVPLTQDPRAMGTKPPRFSRMIDLPGDNLAAVLAEWWANAGANRTALVGGRLVVSAPRVEQGTWTLHGRLRRGLLRRAVPVVVELWAHNSWFTRLDLVPRTRVVTSRRYFRVGHRALDSFGRQLLDRSRQLEQRGTTPRPRQVRSDPWIQSCAREPRAVPTPRPT